ncbi:tetratricopeptide repeat protein [Terrihabitans sp. B22-R8]|uniref:tetratricopeptide repeat protein n=1 Tax=Terrihabitans sp. B22-R8 TaxID=3425128 RepID=UPI00403C33C7
MPKRLRQSAAGLMVSVGRLALRACVGVFIGLAPAFAVDTPPSSDLPDLSAIRARIYSGEYEIAVKDLLEVSETAQHADIYNLLGYSLRHLGRYDEAAKWYKQALYYDPAHRPAIEYQGELFLAIGDFDSARQNVQLLELLCGPAGCRELDILRRALAEAEAVRGAS